MEPQVVIVILPGGLIGITVPCSQQFTAVAVAVAAADYYLFSYSRESPLHDRVYRVFSFAALHSPA